MSITSSNQIKTLLLHRSLEWLTISPRIKTCCPQCTPLFSIVYCLLLPLQVFSADRKFASRSRSRSLGALLCFVKPRGFVSSVPWFGTCWSFNICLFYFFVTGSPLKSWRFTGLDVVPSTRKRTCHSAKIYGRSWTSSIRMIFSLICWISVSRLRFPDRASSLRNVNGAGRWSIAVRSVV